MKIRNRLTFQFTLIVASILLLFSISIYYFSSLYRTQRFNKRLTQRGLTVAKLLITVDEVDINLLRIIDRNNLAALENEKVTVYNELNKKIYNNEEGTSLPLTTNLLEGIIINKEIFYEMGDNEAAGLLYVDKQNRFIILISGYDNIGLSNQRRLQIILITGYIFSIILIFVAGWIFSGQALRPISNIISKVKKITASNLNIRLDEGNGKDEIAHLSITFNEMLQRLENAFESQKSFVSNASHELRTPLTSIKAQLQVSLLNKRSEEDYKKILESVLEDTEKLIDLSNRLLNLAQVSASIADLSLKNIRLDELIFISTARISKKYPKVKIDFDFDQSVEDENELLISANDALMETAFINILDNAAKYSNDLPVKIHLSLKAQTISVQIKDNGIGIDPAEVKYIFEPFYRGNNVRNFQGSGIGLSLSQKIITLHGGIIYINSKPHGGTTVTITLPKINTLHPTF